MPKVKTKKREESQYGIESSRYGPGADRAGGAYHCPGPLLPNSVCILAPPESATASVTPATKTTANAGCSGVRTQQCQALLTYVGLVHKL